MRIRELDIFVQVCKGGQFPFTSGLEGKVPSLKGDRCRAALGL